LQSKHREKPGQAGDRQGGTCRGGKGGHILVTEFRGMALNDLFCADVLRPLDVVPLTDITYKYHPGDTRVPDVHQIHHKTRQRDPSK